MPQKIVVQMPYIGSDLSVNHYLGRARSGKMYVKGSVVSWKEELGWKIKGDHIEDWKLPLTVKCSGVFKDNRSRPDLHNLAKIICDSIEEVTGINDRNMKWVCGTNTLWDDEYKMVGLLITIGEAE